MIKPTWQTGDGSIALHCGSCLDVLPQLDTDSFTACVTDPPYELNFMGRGWDRSGVAFDVATWQAVYRALKPGAHLLAFGGTRTYHRMAVAIEDAGFEIRDCIFWCYGSGFPKSLDVSKAIDKAAGVEREVIGTIKKVDSFGVANDVYGDGPDHGGTMAITAPATEAAKLWQGYGTALKPAVEPIIVARKPLAGTVAANCQEHGCGALNIDGCRIGTESTRRNQNEGPTWSGKYQGGERDNGSDSGRWPANLIHDGSDEVVELFPQTEAGVAVQRNRDGEVHNAIYGGYRKPPGDDVGFGDSGSAARFFYCAKASRDERGEGNTHPTVKPIALMEYLVKLVKMPRGNRLLDPFAGSGSTLVACYRQTVDAVGIDLEPAHVTIASSRLKSEEAKEPLFSLAV